MRRIKCEDCGIDVETTGSRTILCKNCARSRQEETWRKNNKKQKGKGPEYRKAINKRFYDAHQEQQQLRATVYRKAHPEQCRENNKMYRVNNPDYWKQDRVKQVNAEYYQSHKEEITIRNKAYVQANKEKLRPAKRARLVRYRARLANASGEWTVEQFNWLCEVLEHRCYYCGEYCEKLTVDHMTPLSRGGSNDISNIIPACGPCNYSKSDKTAEEFIVWREGHSA